MQQRQRADMGMHADRGYGWRGDAGTVDEDPWAALAALSGTESGYGWRGEGGDAGAVDEDPGAALAA